jgi:hypothetical protein
MGWQIDTWSMSEGVIDEQTFLDDVSFTVAQSKKMMASFLSEKDVTLFVQVYEFTDRVAHCFTRFTDTEHPAYDAEKAGRYGNAIERSYQQMDAIVGEAMKVLGKDDVLIVLSDHGFSSWRRSVNYNTWLVENGYMTLTGQGKEADLEMLFGQGEFWPNVDWSKTKAYAMGLGEIYINVKGREGKGSVAPGAEYEAVRQELIERLGNLTDPVNGRRAVAHVYTREQAYGSFDANLIPDLFVTNTEGYRVSWQASLGVVTKDSSRTTWASGAATTARWIPTSCPASSSRTASSRPIARPESPTCPRPSSRCWACHRPKLDGGRCSSEGAIALLALVLAAGGARGRTRTRLPGRPRRSSRSTSGAASFRSSRSASRSSARATR